MSVPHGRPKGRMSRAGAALRRTVVTPYLGARQCIAEHAPCRSRLAMQGLPWGGAGGRALQ